jgi:hypothetical protein
MNRTVEGIKDALSALPKSTRKVLRYIAKGSLNPYEPVSVECEFAGNLDAYLKKRNDDFSLSPANSVRWSTACCSNQIESPKIFTGELFERIGEKMNGNKKGGPSFIEMNDFLKELTRKGVLHKSQQPGEETRYALTPEASAAVGIVTKLRKFPWSYHIDILPQGPVVTEAQKNSKAFPKYVERFLELEMQIINGR